jgi:hypothetical protein
MRSLIMAASRYFRLNSDAGFEFQDLLTSYILRLTSKK